MGIKDFFKILEEEKVSHSLFLDEILRVKVAQKFIQFGDSEILKNEKVFKEFIKSSIELGLANREIDRVVFNKLYENIKDFECEKIIFEWNKKYKNGHELLNVNFLDFLKPFQKTVFISNAVSQLYFLKDALSKYKNTVFILGVYDKASKVALEFLTHDFKNARVINEINDRAEILKHKYDTIVIFKDKPQNDDYLNLYKNELTLFLPVNKMLDEENIKYRESIFSQNSLKEILNFKSNKIFSFSSLKIIGLKITKENIKKVKIYELDNIKTQLNINKEIEREKTEIICDKFKLKYFYDNNNHSYVKLGEIAQIIRGINSQTSKGNSVKCCNIADLENYELIENKLSIFEISNKLIEKYKLKKNDILLTIRGTKIKSAIFNLNEAIVPTSNLVIIRINSDKILPEFLCLFLDSQSAKEILNKIQRGTSYINLNSSELKDLKIPLIEINKQKQIANDFIKEKNNYKKALLSWNNFKENFEKEILK